MEKPKAANALGVSLSRPPTLPTTNLTSTLGIYKANLLKRIEARRIQEQTKKISVSSLRGSPALPIVSPASAEPLIERISPSNQPPVTAADGRDLATTPSPLSFLRSPSLVPLSEPSSFAPDDSYAAMIPRIPGAILTPPFSPKKERSLHQTTRIPPPEPLTRETASEGVPHIRREVRRDPSLLPLSTIEPVKHRAPKENAKYVFLMILALIFIFHRKLF